MKRIIESITEHDEGNTFDDGMEGYVIKLSTGEELSIGISSGQACCEAYGYAITEDDTSSFIGAELISYDIVDTEKAVQYNLIAGTDMFVIPDLDSGDIMFLNVVTDQGMLQFSVYNSHNGYYGHTATIAFGAEVLKDEVL